jgi:epoxide hydrolase-like predicted phosphatase
MSQSNEIHAVIWDLGGVIVRTHDRSGRARWEKRLGLRLGQLEEIVFRCDTARQATAGQAQVADVWRAVANQLDIPDDELQAFKLDFWSGDQVDYQLIDYIRSLRPQLKTGLLSNAWNDLRHAVEQQWKIADAFDHITISAEVGLAKPDPRIYMLPLEALGVTAQQAVFVDDFKNNIRAAQDVGLHAIQFLNPQQTIDDLEKLLARSN